MIVDVRPTFDEMGLLTAELWAFRSSDTKVKIGCAVLDENHRVVGVGYNGRAIGEPNERESDEQGRSGFVHAEANALLVTNWNGYNHTLYCSSLPCAACARLIVNSGRISRVIYRREYVELYRLENSLPGGDEILRNAGIQVQQLSLARSGVGL